jgi:Type IX secretion system protein PorV
MKTLIKQAIAFGVLSGLILLSSAYAGDVNRTGTAGAQELLIPVGARDLALGGSSVASTNGVEAIYWNPAGLAITNGVETMFSHLSYFADIGVVYGAVGVNAGDFGNLGISLKSVNFGNIPITTEDLPEGTGQTFSPIYLTTGVTYARMLSNRISVGATVNIINESIMSTSATAVGFDVGVRYDGIGIPDLKLAVVLKNVGTNITFGGPGLYRSGTTTSDLRGTQTYSLVGASAELPSQMEIGLAYDYKIDETNRASIFADFENNNYSIDVWKLGAEYSFNNLLFLRGGYTFAPNDPVDASGSPSYLYDYTLGAGINYDLGGVNVILDYAFRHLVRMTSNNVISIKVGF